MIELSFAIYKFQRLDTGHSTNGRKAKGSKIINHSCKQDVRTGTQEGDVGCRVHGRTPLSGKDPSLMNIGIANLNLLQIEEVLEYGK